MPHERQKREMEERKDQTQHTVRDAGRNRARFDKGLEHLKQKKRAAERQRTGRRDTEGVEMKLWTRGRKMMMRRRQKAEDDLEKIAYNGPSGNWELWLTPVGGQENGLKRRHRRGSRSGDQGKTRRRIRTRGK